MQDEQRTLSTSLNSQMSDILNKIHQDDANLEERVQMVVERVNEKLKAQIEGAVLDYNTLVNENAKLLAHKFNQNNEDVKAFVDVKLAEQKIKIFEEKRKMDTIIEGKC